MNFPNNLKSPRGTLSGISINSQFGQVAGLQQAMLEKDQTISNLQGQINKLELKNKECISYQEAMIEYQAKAEQLQNQLLKTNEKLRAKVTECDQLKKKLDIELKQKKDRASSFVRHQDYMKLSNDYKKFREVHRKCDESIKTIEKQMQQKLGAVSTELSQVKQQLGSLNNILATKNSQINELKLQKYNIKSSQSIQSHKDLNLNINLNPNSNANVKSSSNIISSFRIVGEENNSIMKQNGQTEKINYELLTYSRQNDQLRKKVQKLQQQLQQYLHSSVEWSTQQKNQQYTKVIEEYEASMSSMANKLAAVHRLEMQKNSIQQQKRKYQVQCEQLRQQLSSRASYCEGLQKKIRQIQHYKSAYLETDLQNLVLKNEKLNRQVERLQKSVNQKYEQIVELKKQFMNIQITQQTFRLMELSINHLEQSLNSSQAELRKQQDKALQKQEQHFKIQKDMKNMEIEMSQVKSEMAKMNRVVSQKVQKIQFQSTQIKRLQKQNSQKTDLSKSLARLQLQYKKIETKYEQQIDQSNQLAMGYIVLSAEIERRQITGNITKQFMIEFQALKIKAKQTENHAKHLEQRVKRLEHLHKQVVGQSIKISQHLHMSHKRWNHYDTAMQRLLKYLQDQNQRSNQKYEELDSNINTWLALQEQRLKELAKNDPLGENDSPYVKYTTKVTTEPFVFQSVIHRQVDI